MRHEHADLIIEWANGAEIEGWADHENKWVACRAPMWISGGKYRKKPPTPRTIWMAVYSDNSAQIFFSEAELKDYVDSRPCTGDFFKTRTIKAIEVVD